MILTSHPQRAGLHNEVHARPPEALRTPVAISHVVMWCDAAERAASVAHLGLLLRDHHLSAPDGLLNHLRVDLPGFHLRWELHTEFVTWTFRRSVTADAAITLALEIVPQGWLKDLPGRVLSAVHLWTASAHHPQREQWVSEMLNDDSLTGSQVADEQAQVCTDFAIQADGFSRVLVFVKDMSPRRQGRLVQRLLEVETYRMAAMLGLPAAREAAVALSAAESELALLAEAIRSAEREDEPQLLDRLTRLAGQVESQYAATHSRFSASSAYFELVDQRIHDIGETRLAGLQTIGEFMERRLSPARKTCEWVTRRQEALSQRVSRVSHLLRTRVEIEQQQSSRALLAAMNQRQGVQIKLQSTVEGLSVAAITYYIVGLIGYLAKGLQKWGWALSPETTTAIAIPLVAFGVWWSLRRMHHRIVGAH